MTHDFTGVWLAMLDETVLRGERVSPRDQLTLEIPQRTIVVDTKRPVLTIPERKLGYKFMAAEAYWILSGSDKVSEIAPYSTIISQFSDNGVDFFGAYGPKIVSQLDYVVSKLLEDKDSRQAGLTIWRENPPQTKDVPCTVAVFFSIRHQTLNCHVFMRSSDIWLGVPYDVFNFSMLTHLVCCRLNSESPLLITPGSLYLTAASSHLYQRHFEQVEEVLLKNPIQDFKNPQRETPSKFYFDETTLMTGLRDLRDSKPGSYLRWWE